MERHNRAARWAAVLAAIVLAAFVGVVAYNAGIAHGAVAAQQIANGPAAFPVYGWYRPWGFGLFGPLLFIAFWFLVLRTVFWRGPWRGYGCYGRGYYGTPMAFDEWHRRAHERMTRDASGSPHDDDRSRS